MTVLGQMLVNDEIEQDVVKNVKAEFSLTQDKAEGYVEKYWGD